MTTLAWPTTLSRDVQSWTWQLNGHTMLQVSPLNNSSQTLELPGAFWSCSFGYGSFDETDAALVEALLVRLGGRAGRVALWNFSRPRPRGIGGGSPLVMGAGQTGNALIVDAAPVSVTGWLKAGDYVGVNGELKMIGADVNTNGSGVATLSVYPRLRTSPPDNAAVTLIEPKVTMALANDVQAWSVSGPTRTFHQTLNFVEVFE